MPPTPTLHSTHSEPTGRIGIDLGGTKTEVIALTPDGQACFRERKPTPKEDYGAILRGIVGLVREAEQTLTAPAKVGLGMPGALSAATGRVKNANTTCLNGKPLQQDLAQALGRDVRVENDANCMTLSEAVDGAGADGRLVFGVILGTGVGGGLVLEREVWPGRNHIAGEWGHNPMPMATQDDLPLPPCYCGRLGCIETYLCGPALERQYKAHTGQMVSGQALPGLAANNDTVAVHLLRRYCDRLARSLALVINVLDPDVIVLAGGLSNLPGLDTQVTARLPQYVFSDRVDTAVRIAQHGDSSGVRGAAWL